MLEKNLREKRSSVHFKHYKFSGVQNRELSSIFNSGLIIFNILQEKITHSNVLAWRIPGVGDPGGLLSVGSHRVRHD